MSKTSPSSATPSGGEPGTSSLSPSYFRLARYLYAADLVGGKRVLDLGCSDGEGAALLLDRGAQSVVGLDVDAQAVSRGQSRQSARLQLRAVSAEHLLAEGGLLRLVSGMTFDVIFVSGDRTWLKTPGFLSALRWLLSPGGQLIWSACSREAFPSASGAIGYFELLDSLEGARLGPVTMLGQSPFFAAALAPFGVTDPALILDDSLALSEPPDEYVALCGSPPNRPFEVVRLPRKAVQAGVRVEKQEVRVADPQVVAEKDKLSAEKDKLAAELAQLRRDRDGLRDKLTELREKTDKSTAQAESLQQHSDRVQAQADRLQAQMEKLTAQLDKAAQVRKEIEAHSEAVTERLKASEEARQRAEAIRTELEERERQRARHESETGEAALLHEKQMRELRTAIEERDAFVAELEDQARELPRIQERLAQSEKRADEASQKERAARQRQAEVEGLLLRARTEMAEQLQKSSLPQDLDARQRNIEAARRENLVAQAELEERTHALTVRQQEVAEAQRAVEQQRAELQRLQEERAAAEAATVARIEAERDRLNQDVVTLRAELAERDERLSLAQKRLEAVMVAPRSMGDGVPLAVGDIPTAPVVISSGGPSRSEEVAALRARTVELEAEVSRLKDKVSDAEREAWKQIKARSEAESAAAEVREDTVRKLRDARKLATVEMTRAMEEATKKAVQLREELGRTEVERKEAVVQLKELKAERDVAQEQLGHLRAELEALRWASTDGASGSSMEAEVARIQKESLAALQSLRGENERLAESERTIHKLLAAKVTRVQELEQSVSALEQSLRDARERVERESRSEATDGQVRPSDLGLAHDLQARERAIIDLKAERDALGRLLSEVEREAFARGERARQLKVSLSERERELETLRVELTDRDRRLTAIDQQSPSSVELRQLQEELAAARWRIEDLSSESNRRTQQDDEVVATALRERARVERLTEVVGQTTRERDEAFHRASELEQRLGQVLAEGDRLRSELSRVSGETPPTILPSEQSAKTESPSHSFEERRTPHINPATAQRVKQVQDSLGLEPLYIPHGDDSESK
jgi:SAM-dependent methyltransferase